MSVADIVTNDYRAADIFKKYQIDFCCGGKRSVQEACLKANGNFEKLIEELYALKKKEIKVQNFDEWELDQLSEYIVRIHHHYVNENLDLIGQYAEKVSKVHGVQHPEVIEIASLFAEIKNELTAHMRKEEVVLFPYITQLVGLKQKNLMAERPPFGPIQNPIKMMEMEHEHAGELMHRIRELSQHYTAPVDACNTYRVLFAKLEEFENDLHLHVHLENNILFPRAIELELHHTAQTAFA